MMCSYCDREIIDDASFCPFCDTPVENARECTEFDYEAFISYRHLPRDREVAVTLQKAIEGFRIPRHLRAEGGPVRLGKLFRDEDELPTSSSLTDQIRDALKHSRYLFVICSPQTNESQWVAREIELFTSYHGRDKVRIVLAEAEPDDSFPTLLRTKLIRNVAGELVEVEEEPLAADFRDLSRKHVNTEKLRLIAPLVGCGFDDLRQRMKTRRMRVATAAASAVAAVSLAFGSFSTYQQFQIQENYRQMQIKESEALAIEANDLFAQGDRMQAIQVSLAALPESEAAQNRPYVPAAQLALENALEVYPADSYWQSCYSLPNDRFVSTVASGDGYIATVGEDRKLIVRDVTTGAQICAIDVETAMGFGAHASLPVDKAFFVGDDLICVRDDALACFDAITGDMRWISQNDEFDDLYSVVASGSGTKLAFISQPLDYSSETLDGSRYKLHVLDTATGALLEEEMLPQAGDAKEYYYNQAAALCFIDDDTVAIAGGKALFLVDLKSGSCTTADVAYGIVDSIDYLNGQLYVMSKESAYNDLQPVSIEVFDPSGKELWSFERDLTDMGGYVFSEHGATYIPRVSIGGVWQPDGVERPYVLISFGTSIMLLDTQDGSMLWSETYDAPFVACASIKYGGVTIVVACSNAGDLIWRMPEVSEKTGTLDDETIGDVRSAEFIFCGGETYLSARDFDGTGRRLYCFSNKFRTEDVELLDDFENVSIFAWNRNRDYLVVKKEAGYAVYDGETLERRFGISFFDLPEPITATYEQEVYCSDDGRIYIYGTSVDEQGKVEYDILAVNVLSADDGSILASYKIHDQPNPSTPFQSFDELFEVSDSSGNVIGVALVYSKEVRIVDYLTGEVLFSCIREGRVSDAWVTAPMAIVSEEDSEQDAEAVEDYRVRRSRFALVDLATGETIDCDLTGSYIGDAAGYDEPVACLSDDGTRFAAACSTGGVQMFDAQTGKIIWKSEQVPEQVSFLVISSTTGDVFLQDTSGTCMLLSGKDGSVLCTSSTTLPPIAEHYGMINDKELVVRWRIPGMSQDIGLAVISLDKESFGPRSNIYEGFFITPDGSTVLVANMVTQQYGKMHCYSLDELIANAHKVTVGHELTDAERYLYRIN